MYVCDNWYLLYVLVECRREQSLGPKAHFLKNLSEKFVAVIGQDEVQHEFPIHSWRISITEH
jgi:hypothetical protein